MNKIAKNTYIFLLAVFILSLIPMYAVGFYAHPSIDDYYYGADTLPTWQATHSVTAVMGTSYKEMINTYNKWQGNFVAIFLMRLEPGLFGEDFYVIAPIVLITTFVLASLAFYKTLLSKIFYAGKYVAASIAIGITFLSMQLVPVPSDSFYWYNGAIYYTFFYSLALILLTLIIQLLYLPKKRSFKGILTTITAFLLAFILGGGNYLTALSMSVMLFLFCGYGVFCVIKNKHEEKSSHANSSANIFNLVATLLLILITVTLLISFFINISAPGNRMRQSETGATTSLVKTFILTFMYGGYALAGALNAPTVVFIVAISPLLYHLAKKTGEKTAFSFPMPFLFAVISFGILCSQGTPVFYAQGLRMPYRASNIIYFSTFIFMIINLIYFYGYIYRKFGKKPLLTELENAFSRITESGRKTAILLAVLLVCFSITCIGGIKVSEAEYKSGNAAFSGMTTSVAATVSLITGDAKTYDAELTARHIYLSECTDGFAVVPALTKRPDPIFHNDITPDPLDWKNAHLALYYAPVFIYTE